MKLTASFVLFLIPFSVVFVKCKDQKEIGPERLDAQEFCKRVAIKLWVSFLLRENLLKFFENKPSIKDEVEWYYSNKYLYDALKYREIDTFPLISTYECFLNQEPIDQLETALSQLSNHSPKYIKCAIDVVLEDIKTNRKVEESEWDLTTDLQDMDRKTIEQVYRPIYEFSKQRIYKINSAGKALDAVWSRIFNGYRPPQRLIGVMLLSVPMSSKTLSDQVYVGEFLYLEKISKDIWNEIITKSEIKNHSNMIKFLRTVLLVTSTRLEPSIDLGISPTKYIDKLPENIEDVKKMFEKVSESLLEFKTVYRGGYGRRKRFINMTPDLLKGNNSVEFENVQNRLPEEVPEQIYENLVIYDTAGEMYLMIDMQKPITDRTLKEDENRKDLWSRMTDFAKQLIFKEPLESPSEVNENKIKETVLSTLKRKRSAIFEQDEEENEIPHNYGEEKYIEGSELVQDQNQPTKAVTEMFVPLNAQNGTGTGFTDTSSSTSPNISLMKNRTKADNETIQRSLNKVLINLNQKINKTSNTTGNDIQSPEEEGTTIADAKIFFLSQATNKNNKGLGSPVMRNFNPLNSDDYLESNYENYENITSPLASQTNNGSKIDDEKILTNNKFLTPSEAPGISQKNLQNVLSPTSSMTTKIPETSIKETTLGLENIPAPRLLIENDSYMPRTQEKSTSHFTDVTISSTLSESDYTPTESSLFDSASKSSQEKITTNENHSSSQQYSSLAISTTTYKSTENPPVAVDNSVPIYETSHSMNSKRGRKNLRAFFSNLKSLSQVEEFFQSFEDEPLSSETVISDYLSSSIKNLLNHILQNKQVISKMQRNGTISYDKFLPKTIPNTEEFRQIQAFRNYLNQPGLLKSLQIESTNSLTDFETFLMIIKQSLKLKFVPKTSVLNAIMKTYMMYMQKLYPNHMQISKWTTQLIEKLPRPKTESQEVLLSKIKDYLMDFENQNFELFDVDDLQSLTNFLTKEINSLFQSDLPESDYEYLWPLIGYYLSD